MKNKWIRLAAVVVVTALIMSVGSIGAYGMVVKPQYYNRYMENGQRFLDAGAYEQAVLEYNKAISIDARSTDARLGAGKGYVGAGETGQAVAVLRQAQELDARNTALLQEIVDILKDVAPEDAYDILRHYVDLVGEDNIASEMEPMIQSAGEPPVTPLVSPGGEAYVSPVQVSLTTDKLRVGHTIHYTLDGSEPTRESPVYQGIFTLEEDTVVRAVSVGPDGQRSASAQAAYTFDADAVPALRALYEQARQEVVSAQVGTQPGNCVAGAHEEAEPALELCRALLERFDNGETLALAPVAAARAQLAAALEAFRLKIIERCDKDALDALLQEAEALYGQSAEGSADGQYKAGSRAALRTAIDAARAVYDNILTRQAQADEAVQALEEALKTFDKNMVKLVVNPDGTNFTYGFKTLMGDETSITYTGTFKVVNSGTADCYGGDVSMSAGETGTITLTFTRSNNTVTVNSKASWYSGKSIWTRGTWYAEYDGETQYFLLYPQGKKSSSSDRYEGYFTDGKMSGKVYYSGMGYALDFTAS